MTLTVRAYDNDTAGLYDHVATALQQLGERTPVADELVLVGPFPVYVLNPIAVANGATSVYAERPTGWRGIVLEGGEAIACVDLPSDGSVWETPSVRGQDAANVLQSALTVAQEAEGSARTYDLRIIQLPRVFVCAVWLAGPASAYIPTRAGGIEQTDPHPLRRKQFIGLVKRCLRQAVTGSNDDTGGGDDAARNDPPRRR